jgi:excisionase family DNA binding protein
MTSTDPYERMAYRPDEVPRVFPIGRTMLFRLMKEGKIRTVKVGRARLIPAESLREFLRDPAA